MSANHVKAIITKLHNAENYVDSWSDYKFPTG
jgi:hypothetical protein